MRHGKTDWNAKDVAGPGHDAEVLRGNIDIPLNAEGAQTVHEHAIAICQQYPVHEVHSTPALLRAKQTRAIVAAVCNVPEVDAPEFSPWDPGYLSGQPIAAVETIIEFLMDIPFIPAPGGQSYGAYVQNFTNAWQALYQEWGGDDSRAVVVILFGNEFRVLPKILEGKPVDRYSQQKVKPGDYVVVH